jgi:hypothetical protein
MSRWRREQFTVTRETERLSGGARWRVVHKPTGTAVRYPTLRNCWFVLGILGCPTPLPE